MNIDMKQQIINATIEIGAGEGISKIGNTLIAAKCGVTTASIYYYFHKKYDLIFEAALTISNELSEYVFTRLSPAGDVEDHYEKMLYCLADYFLLNPARCIFYTRAITTSDYKFTSEHINLLQSHCPICNTWKKGVEENKFKGDLGAQYLALAYTPLCLFLSKNFTYNTKPLKKEIKSFIDGMCKAIKA